MADATLVSSPRRTQEWVINLIIKLSGYSSILFVTLIFIFLMREGLPALRNVPLSSILGERWYPIEGYFSILPLIYGSLVVTVGALLLAIPFGVGTSVFLSEIAPPWMNQIIKPLIEILAGLPSVVLGFLGIQVAAPYLRRLLDLPTGLSAFSGAVLLALIATPTIVSITEDALNTVPSGYRQAALALGATRWQVIWGVTVPAARSGILTAVMLGVGRSIGETMAVMMVTGNAPVLPSGWDFLFTPVRTMTATIASEMGEVANGSTHYQVLFFIGIVLFVISLVVNIVASSVSLRGRTRAERVLS
ncbi:MAG TPA: phosphate ABC transporter permease subunit PstC [Anaerolinea thermolimosa]|uniref:Phosphate transport system permease protein n=1 Tax=Anaerolinea thermolimosa TaxID=229919 RepID=A0A3D1JF28_9CHLR|nr:phosphate ABC transporter permease subunit PstC [Anaerolinea thermolimosa]GAP05600.1 phosphate ABC transporter membrane protein 1, PhoT family [Anaerolinea thermolimosa]HCE16825.1 phosphate ABC transporter permease subunit PstC [Anaerolinea thermolimosa]